MPAQRYTAAAIAASSMSCGERVPSLSPSTPAAAQVPGMNCIGPTARSQIGSRSSSPASVSRIVAMPGDPSSGRPMTAGRETPSVPSTAPPYRPWSDSTRPTAASSVHEILQAGSTARRTVAARW